MSSSELQSTDCFQHSKTLGGAYQNQLLVGLEQHSCQSSWDPWEHVTDRAEGLGVGVDLATGKEQEVLPNV